MNRAQRRAADARAKMAKNAERVKAIVEDRNSLEQQLDWMRMLLFATAREHGRLLVRAEHIRGLGPEDRVDFVRRDNGDVVVEYAAGQ